MIIIRHVCLQKVIPRSIIIVIFKENAAGFGQSQTVTILTVIVDTKDPISIAWISSGPTIAILITPASFTIWTQFKVKFLKVSIFI